MIVFRISSCKYITDLSGKGAEKCGGRWNTIGVPVVYTSASRALCTAEIAVHLPLGILPENYCIAEIKIPDTLKIKEILPEDLPVGWQESPPVYETQILGNKLLLQNKYAILKMPSAVVPGDFNYLINPLHKDFKKIKFLKSAPFQFDVRLFYR